MPTPTPHTYVDPTGLFTLPEVVANLNARQTLTTMAIGGVANAGFGAAGGGGFSWRRAAVDFATGAATSGIGYLVARSSLSTLGRVVVLSLTGAGGTAAGDVAAGRGFDPCSTVWSALMTPVGQASGGWAHRAWTRHQHPALDNLNGVEFVDRITDGLMDRHPFEGEGIGTGLGFAEFLAGQAVCGLVDGEK